MPVHIGTIGLAEALRDHGVHTTELAGWRENQTNYFWTDSDDTHDRYAGVPNGAAWHHTVSTRYVPYVKNAKGQTKACGWAGIWRDGALWQYGDDGVATYVLASAGPANYSNGANNREVIDDYLPTGVRFNGPQRKPDTPGFYGNRYTWTTEVVARGHGTAEQMLLRDDVYEMIVNAGLAMCQFFDWSPYQHVAHSDLSRRKIDIQISNHGSDPYSISRIQDDIAAGGSGLMWLNDMYDSSWMTWFNDTTIPGVVGEGRYYCSNDGTYDFAAKTGVAWGDGPIDGKASYSEKVHAYNVVFSGFALALDQT